MNDYERIATVIRYLEEHREEQPGLQTLARQLNLSSSRFHRLFVSWAGVTPKRFLQALTLHHAKALLREGESVLLAALYAGLSGPGRLHDFFVTLEGATPGEWKAGGAGVNLSYGVAQSPFGKCLIAWTRRGLCRLAFFDGGPEASVAELRCDWPNAVLTRNDAQAARTASRIFRTVSGRPPVRLFAKGTPFQLRVWSALLRIPEGALASYRGIARAIGRPRCARAVGAAVGSNPIAFLIPCHRVIRATGAPGGYRWGTSRKRAIIAWESATKSA